MKTLGRAECRAEIVRRLRTIGPDSGRRWGRMTPHEMICHLADGCRMATGALGVRAATRWIPRSLVRWIVLYGPLRWPAGVPTSPELDQRCGGTRPGQFEADVAALERLLASLASRGGDWPAHPVFGRMSRADWLRWAYLHTDHHLRQFGA